MLDKIRNSKLMFWSLEILIIVGIINGLSAVSFIFRPVGTFFSTMLIPLVTALFLYYIFNPLIKMLERMHVKRIVSVPILFVLLLGLIALAFSTLIPNVVHQFTQLIAAIPSLLHSMRGVIAKYSHYHWYQEMNVGKQLAKIKPEKIASGIFKSVSTGLPGIVGSVAGTIFSLITIPIVLFYMLKDGKQFVPSVERLFPERYRGDIASLFDRMNDTLSHYISGQAIECIFIGVFMGVSYVIIHQPYGLLLAVFSGVATVVPYLGPYIGLIPAVLIAGTQGWKQVLLVIAATIIVHTIDGNFIYPNVIGRSLDVHPLTIIIILLVVSHLYGLVGTILAVPVYAVVKTIVIYVWQIVQIRQNPPEKEKLLPEKENNQDSKKQ